MRWMLPLFTGLLLAQPPQRPRIPFNPFSVISGRVFDADTGDPVREAQVHVLCRRTRGRMDELTLLTSSNGMFNTRMINEEGCTVSVLAEGYLPSRQDAERGPVRLPPASAAAVEFLRFGVHREAEVAGTVIDRGTERPVAGLTVWAQWSDFERGKRKLRAAADAVSTDAEGRFRLKRLPPGNYFLQVAQREQERIEGRARPEEYSSGYARAYWPDGAHEAAIPLWVYAGARLDAGVLFVQKQPLYRAHGIIRTPLCAPGRRYRTVLWQQQGPGFVVRANDAVACGAAFTVHNLTQGTWWLEARLEGVQPSDADLVLEPLDVRDKDLTVELQPLPALKLGLKIASGGEAMLLPAGLPAFAPPQPEKIERGAAVLTAPASEKVELHLFNLDPNLAVTAIRYNGGSTDDGSFSVNRSAPSQLVEVETTGRPATLSGQVMNGEKPRPGALVVLASWPAALRADWPRTRRGMAGDDGTFSFPALPPGEYRVFAIDAGQRAKLEEPGVLLRLIANARTVQLSEGESLKAAISAASPD